MPRQVLITLDDEVYEMLEQRFGAGRIGAIVEAMLQPLDGVGDELDAGYHQMAADDLRERDAAEWADALIGDGRG